MIGFSILFVIVIRKCSFHTLPKQRITSTKLDIQHKYTDNQYQLTIKNLLACPNRIYLSSSDTDLHDIVGHSSPFVLVGKADTTITVSNKGDLKDKINIKFKWGNPELPIQTSKIESLPFPKNKSYELMQGNNTNPTHNHDVSRYAFDFSMKIGDTITSSQNGYVVTLIDGYKGWGRSSKWKAFSNQLMIYDTSSNLFTMYGHIKQHGSLVELGSFVEIGEPIALSGKTGLAPEEHLHFNVFQADDGKSGLTSFRLDSIGNYKVKELKRYQLMIN